ncbi:MAG: 2-amino-4-hydroxy-6-hydroxymethyldihydropteridine diphosphokinase [Phycisphaerales bacterium]|nr:MAG: 2-amino-4-hydroxy-6-hydroxymethyldihydropteridine diphosphokinase [Phycisphaerales bacterium]
MDTRPSHPETPSTPGPSEAVAFIALGANLGDRAVTIGSAFESVRILGGVRLEACSNLHETAPVGGPPDQPAYLNAAVRVRTTLGPRELLAALHAVERAHGRDRAREARWGPRTLDLDLLIYADLVIDEPGLTVPHPRLVERLFVLEPLAEVGADAAVPGPSGGGRTVASLLRSLRNASGVGGGLS